MSDLTHLPNIGTALSEKLNQSGITNDEALIAIGSVEAVLHINDQDLSTCYNMLYAIEGAIQGVRWFAISKEERTQLKQEFDRAFSNN
ncbi:MAG: TfoX/Sxy family protein [Chloroflexi bacterium]|nr:TfoX/Sxy family protein [Chloroflexota bacterium]